MPNAAAHAERVFERSHAAAGYVFAWLLLPFNAQRRLDVINALARVQDVPDGLSDILEILVLWFQADRLHKVCGLIKQRHALIQNHMEPIDAWIHSSFVNT
jgi:hypothetical protein